MNHELEFGLIFNNLNIEECSILLNLKAQYLELWMKHWSPFNCWELVHPKKQIFSSALRQILIV